eukprot:15446564-Alexandrium_andersonii.AAC.1
MQAIKQASELANEPASKQAIKHASKQTSTQASKQASRHTRTRAGYTHTLAMYTYTHTQLFCSSPARAALVRAVRAVRAALLSDCHLAQGVCGALPLGRLGAPAAVPQRRSATCSCSLPGCGCAALS